MVAHSPTPSAVNIIASSKGDGKKALAAWLKWCSENNIFVSSLKFLSCCLKRLVNNFF